MIKSARNRSGLLCYWDDVLNAKKVKSPLEKVEQKQLNAKASFLWPDIEKMFFHVVNESGNSGDQRYGAELNRMGRKKGVPDWLVMVPKKGFYGLYIELKRSRKEDSSISKESREFLLQAESLGYKCAVAYGYLSAIEIMREYLK